MRRSFAVLLSALAVSACAPARAEPAMWVVKDADSQIYLLGTVHLLRPELVWKTPKIAAALDACADLTLEIPDVGSPTFGPEVVGLGVDPTHPLSTRLTDKERASLAQAAATLGMDPRSFEPMRPWLAAVQLSVAPLVRAGYDPTAGVDRLIAEDARAKGKPVRGFETAEQQLRMLANLPEAAQLDFLREALDDYADAEKELDELANAWAAGRTGEIDKLVNEEMRDDNPVLYRTILADRNAAFARQIKAMLAASAGPRCVAVGAGHLAGSDSVQAKLKALGVKSERY